MRCFDRAYPAAVITYARRVANLNSVVQQQRTPNKKRRKSCSRRLDVSCLWEWVRFYANLSITTPNILILLQILSLSFLVARFVNMCPVLYQLCPKKTMNVLIQYWCANCPYISDQTGCTQLLLYWQYTKVLLPDSLHSGPTQHISPYSPWGLRIGPSTTPLVPGKISLRFAILDNVQQSMRFNVDHS